MPLSPLLGCSIDGASLSSGATGGGVRGGVGVGDCLGGVSRGGVVGSCRSPVSWSGRGKGFGGGCWLGSSGVPSSSVVRGLVSIVKQVVGSVSGPVVVWDKVTARLLFWVWMTISGHSRCSVVWTTSIAIRPLPPPPSGKDASISASKVLSNFSSKLAGRVKPTSIASAFAVFLARLTICLSLGV